ncbi:MAG: HAD-IIIA family hydrolase [Candidatus Omnitrophota bacterium]
MNKEKFIFLDRDGVINRDPGAIGKEYVTSWEEFAFLPGVLESIKELSAHGYRIAVISNQAGVGRGVYSKVALDEITSRMVTVITAAGGTIDSVQYCIHKRDDNCDCRKPKTGSLKKAVGDRAIDLANSYFIGDSRTDVEAGRALGCKTILVLSGKTKSADETLAWEIKPDAVEAHLLAAVKLIGSKKVNN